MERIQGTIQEIEKDRAEKKNRQKGGKKAREIEKPGKRERQTQRMHGREKERECAVVC